MTNAAAAAHFAALPAEATAKIVVVNGDTATISFEELRPTAEATLADTDADAEDTAQALGRPTAGATGVAAGGTGGGDREESRP